MSIPVIASGGIHVLADVEALCAVQEEGISGVICGRSIYEGTLDLSSAQERADELTTDFTDYLASEDSGEGEENEENEDGPK